MFHPNLLGVLLLELTDISRVPELRGDAKVLAAAHERVRLAALAGSGDRLLGEVGALAAGLGYESKTSEIRIRICQRSNPRRVMVVERAKTGMSGRKKKKKTYRPCTTSAYSLVTSLSAITSSPLGARPHPPGPKAWFRIRRYLISGRYTTPSGLISTSRGSRSLISTAAVSGGKGFVASPWKDEVQFMGSPFPFPFPFSLPGLVTPLLVDDGAGWKAAATPGRLLLVAVGI